MVSFDHALHAVLSRSSPLGKEEIPLEDGPGRILFSDVTAREDFPPFDSSSTDGFAVRWADVCGVLEGSYAELRVIGEASAGHVCEKPVCAGEAVRMMTGGKVPSGADTVVPVEETELAGKNRILVIRVQKKGKHVRTAGRDARLGEIVLHGGTRIASNHLGLLGSLGHARVPVHKLPRVKIVPTGDELVPVGQTPPVGRIRSGNSYALAGFVKEAGGEAELCGIVPDNKEMIKKGIRDALPSDVLLIVGGVSTGKYDLVKPALEDCGAKIVFWQVNMKPGKPVLFATMEGTLVFGLPGNPGSAMVTFLQFVRPVIWRMSGQVENQPLRGTATLEHSVKNEDGRRHFLRGRAREVEGRVWVAATGSQSSGSLRSLLAANCLIVLPEDISHLSEGSEVGIEWL